MGKAGLYLKISILVIGLVIVFVAIRGLTPEKVQGAFEAMGLEQGAKPAEGEDRRKLCQTRIHAVRFADGRTVIEGKQGVKLDWTAEDATSAETSGSASAPAEARSINTLEVEKWFSLHCMFVTAPASVENLEPSNEPVKFVTFEFIDGTKWELYRSGDVFASAADPKDRFVSAELLQALEDLRAIAGFPVDSKDR